MNRIKSKQELKPEEPQNMKEEMASEKEFKGKSGTIVRQKNAHKSAMAVKENGILLAWHSIREQFFRYAQYLME